MTTRLKLAAVLTPQGRLTLARSEKAEPFHCGRCDKDKKAKLQAKWDRPDGTTVTICNGCYGEILSKEER